jgi:hypothetical protein
MSDRSRADALWPCAPGRAVQRRGATSPRSASWAGEPGPIQSLCRCAFDGSRLRKLYAEDLDHEAIIAKLDLLFAAYAAERPAGERFGAFVIRAGFVAQAANGADFHANIGARRHV